MGSQAGAPAADDDHVRGETNSFIERPSWQRGPPSVTFAPSRPAPDAGKAQLAERVAKLAQGRFDRVRQWAVMTLHWRLYVAERRFDVPQTLREAGLKGLCGGLFMSVVSAWLAVDRPVLASDLVGCGLIGLFVAGIMTAVGMCMRYGQAKAAAERARQPLVVVWRRRR